MENTGKYRHLGIRAYWMFLFNNARIALGILVLIIALLIASQVLTLDVEYMRYVSQAFVFLQFLLIAALLGAGLIGWLQYLANEFQLDEHALKIRTGILNVDIDAIPYRQIQNVSIERDVVYRIFGISRLVILTAGTEDATTDDESEGIIPALDKKLAAEIQEELLQRANIEKVQGVRS